VNVDPYAYPHYMKYINTLYKCGVDKSSIHSCSKASTIAY
jgi:hypothetical protein